MQGAINSERQKEAVVVGEAFGLRGGGKMWRVCGIDVKQRSGVLNG